MATQRTEQYIMSPAQYLDAAMIIVDDITALSKIAASSRFIGQTALVKNDGHPIEFWLVSGTTNQYWKVKLQSEFDSYASLTSYTQNVVSTLCVKLKKAASNAFTIGTEAIVKEDETNDGKLSKYWVSKIETSGSTCAVTWERKKYAEDVDTHDIAATAAEIIEMLEAEKYGNVIYSTSGSVYSYIDSTTGKKTWTDDPSEIPTGTDYTEYPEGLYVIAKDSDGNANLEKIPAGGDLSITGGDTE